MLSPLYCLHKKWELSDFDSVSQTNISGLFPEGSPSGKPQRECTSSRLYVPCIYMHAR